VTARQRTIADDCFCGRVGDDYTLLLCKVDAPIPYVLTPRGKRDAAHIKQWDVLQPVLEAGRKAAQTRRRAALAEGRKIERRVKRTSKSRRNGVAKGLTATPVGVLE
jgi:hypothetical protein